MTLHQFHLVCFAVGTTVHGVQTVLVWKLWRQTSGTNRAEAKEGLAICGLAFLWQFGNFWREFAITLGFSDGSIGYEIGNATRAIVLLGFPLLFSYMLQPSCAKSRIVRAISLVGRYLRYPLWLFTPAAVVSIVLSYLGKHSLLDPDFAEMITLNVMMFYFLAFFAVGMANAQAVRISKSQPMQRANRAYLMASFLGLATFVLMLWFAGRLGQFQGWFQLAAMMTSVPFTVALAYRSYQFPFMDAFLRDVLSGVTLLVLFCIAYTFGPHSADLHTLWMAVMALGLAFAKGPVSRWVDRKFLGYSEALEDQEERIGSAIHALTQLSDFGERVSEILAQELEADWVHIEAEPSADAAVDFQITGSSPMWLSIGPRKGARSYMSRQLRLAKHVALELATQHERLQREHAERRQLVQEHELRAITARAQVRALQAQINPHFLFNTLNVLASLIHSNPAKAELVTEDLAEIFRYALESTRNEWVKMDDELHFIESYLEIERTRFDERLTYSFDVDATVRSMRIPPMILQPLVENAVRHGIGQKIEGGQVRIAAKVEGEKITVFVEDTGAGLAHRGKGGSGIGLANVRERLAHVYGQTAVLRLEAIPSGGTRAALILPQHVEVHA